MNKQDIAEKVHGVLGTTKADGERAVETMVDTIVGALKRGEEVSIAGLGIFKTKMRAARTARNPRTGEAVQVPSMRVPKFQPAKALKEAVK
ncbi:MAG: HU family DNA-binding protein [Patescibacteria group bacterium]